MVEIFPKLTEEEAASLEEFKNNHSACDNLVYGLDKPVGNCFVYKYQLSTMGGMVSVECPCGAEWSTFEGSIFIEPAPIKDYGEHSRGDVECVKEILRALDCARLYFPGGPDHSLRHIQTLFDGMTYALTSIGDGQVLNDIRKHFNLKSIKDPDRYYELSSFGEAIQATEENGGQALAAWREEFESYLIETYPSIAKECGLVESDGVSPR